MNPVPHSPIFSAVAVHPQIRSIAIVELTDCGRSAGGIPTSGSRKQVGGRRGNARGGGNLLPRLSPRCTWTLPRRVGLSCQLFLRYTAKFMDLFESNWMTVNVEVAGDSSAIPISVLSSTTRQRSWPYARHRCCRRIWWPACSDTQPL